MEPAPTTSVQADEDDLITNTESVEAETADWSW